jgi:hypothetical protein
MRLPTLLLPLLILPLRLQVLLLLPVPAMLQKGKSFLIRYVLRATSSMLNQQALR